MATAIGKNVQRKEAWEKVTARAVYTDDLPQTGLLTARLLTSTCAHADILSIDTSAAMSMKGVKAVVTGKTPAPLFGPLLADRPPLARDLVRYAGEPLALVVARDEKIAAEALGRIRVRLRPLPAVLTPTQALAKGAPLIHRQALYQKIVPDVYPEPGTNIASRTPIRKGDAGEAFGRCAHIEERSFSLPPSVHMAMEVRTARCEIGKDGTVRIETASQGPYSVITQLSEAFNVPAGLIRVQVPLVGGGFGGKTACMTEILAYLASLSVGGKPVRLILTREQDMSSAPGRAGLEARVRLGADADGNLLAADIAYHLDCGAYADIAPYIAKAIATDCTGPYRIDNVSCDALCVYTNHNYATAYRSFSREALTFCIERVMDALARDCGKDPLNFRWQNALRPGCSTPTQAVCTPALIGDLPRCIEEVKTLSGWDGVQVRPIKENTVRAMGTACFWKTQTPPTDAVSGAVVTFNADGSANLLTGSVEIGSGSQTRLAQILAEKLGVDTNQIHVVLPTDTRIAPHNWKTAASLTEHMAGQAVVEAADDALCQLRETASKYFTCPPGDIEVMDGKVYPRETPNNYIAFKDIVHGFKTPDGSNIGEPVIGRGRFMFKGLTELNPQTGQGKPGPSWTPGAQVVEIEADLTTFTYRLLTASTVMDVGRAINPEGMRAVIAGGMAMGLSLASREAVRYDALGVPEAPNLRSYKLLHLGQEPDYRVGFVETPESDTPYGVRSYSEHGIIGMPAALANALSAAFGRDLTTLPLTPEALWRSPKEGSR